MGLMDKLMNKSSVKGFDKYNEMGNNFFNLINGIKNIEGGKTVYLIMHEDTDENGNVKPKTIGKLLADKVNIQGMFKICIRSMFWILTGCLSQEVIPAWFFHLQEASALLR